MAPQVDQIYHKDPQLSEKARRLLAAHDREVRRGLRSAQPDGLHEVVAG